jgi:hypothetical protein
MDSEPTSKPVDKRDDPQAHAYVENCCCGCGGVHCWLCGESREAHVREE